MARSGELKQANPKRILALAPTRLGRSRLQLSTMEIIMRLTTTLAAGAAILGMTSTAWASIGPATMSNVVEVAEGPILDMAHVPARPFIAADHERKAPIVRIAGRTSRG